MLLTHKKLATNLFIPIHNAVPYRNGSHYIQGKCLQNNSESPSDCRRGIRRLHCHALLGIAKARIKVEVEELFSCHSDRLLGWPAGLGRSIGHLANPENQNWASSLCKQQIVQWNVEQHLLNRHILHINI